MAGDVSTDTSTKVLYVRVDGELHRDLKMSAVACGVSLQSLCETILRAHVEQQRESGATTTITLVMAPASEQSFQEGESRTLATPTR
jgi:hypothetical protein